MSGFFVLLLTLAKLYVSTFLIKDKTRLDDLDLGKIFHTSLNLLGFLASLLAFCKIQRLSKARHPHQNSVDLFLMDFGVFIIYVYNCLLITVGVSNISNVSVGIVYIINGVMEILAVTLQTILVHQLFLVNAEGGVLQFTSDYL